MPKFESLQRITALLIVWTLVITKTSFSLAKSIVIDRQLLQSPASPDSIEFAPFLSLLPRVDDDDVLLEYGKFITSAMNQSIDPCEDFYDYACGNWKNLVLIPEKSRNDSFMAFVQLQIDEMLLKFLRNSTTMELSSNTASAKAKALFKSCTEMYEDIKAGLHLIWELNTFSKELNETMDWISINFMSPYGIYPLLPLTIFYYPLLRKNVLAISPPIVTFDNIDDLKNLTKHFDERLISKELEEVRSFEKNFETLVTTRNKTELLKLEDFIKQHEADAFNWTRYFQIAFNGSEQSDWIVFYPIEDVQPLIRFLNKSDLNTMRNYVKWHTLVNFYEKWTSVKDDKSLTNSCLKFTKLYFKSTLFQYLLENIFNADRRAHILQIAKHVKETFYDLLDKYTWLDDETKSNAKTKLSAMDIHVGYTDDMRHSELVDQVFASVAMTENFFKNALILEENTFRMSIRSVNKANEVSVLYNPVVNAFYNPTVNSVSINIGLVQMPVYHMKFPFSMNFGALGSVIGHEISHGFDSTGYKFDYDGKINNWWTEASLRSLWERYNCLESQYNKYAYRGYPTNGSFTSGEDISDNLGTRIAYYAYMNNYGNEDGHKKPILGLNFTNKQLFFLRFAQTHCSGESEADNIRLLKEDDHSLGKIRVMGSLSNMPEFSEVFQCKLGSGMNPLKKCIIW